MDWFLKLLGIDPLGRLIDGATRAYDLKLNAKTEHEKIEADRQIAFYTGALQDLSDARSKAGTYPWWLALPMAMIAIPVGLHTGLIYTGTLLAPIISGTPIGVWLLHIPAPPAPYDQTGTLVVGFFFGAATSLGLGALAYRAFTQRKG